MEKFMNCQIIHNSVRSVLDDGQTAYTTIIESGGVPNMDYAGYCVHVALNRLRQSLNYPDLTTEQLEGLLRRAARKYSSEEPQKSWTSVMARYLRRHVNSNESVSH